MKRIHSLILTALFLVGGMSASFAADMTKGEREAQTAIRSYLSLKGYATKIDNADNSVNFQSDNNLFWITFSESGNGMLYTLHRRPVKMYSPDSDDDTNTRRLENAVVAANLMNDKYPFKTSVSSQQVDFSFPMYAARVSDFTDAFPSMLKSMANIKADFDRCYETARKKNEETRIYWAENNPNVIVVPQEKGLAKPVKSSSVTVSNVDFRIVDGKDKVVKDYGSNLRKSEMKYIQPKVSVTAGTKGVYELGMVITTPDGKTLMPSNDTDRTVYTSVEIDKKNKDVEFEKFGSKDGDIWQPGEYKVTFYEGHTPIYVTTFNIL